MTLLVFLLGVAAPAQGLNPVEWERSGSCNVAVAGDTIIEDATPAGFLRAVDARSGAERWRVDVPRVREGSSPPFVSGKHFVVVSDPRVATYNVVDGSRAWSIRDEARSCASGSASVFALRPASSAASHEPWTLTRVDTATGRKVASVSCGDLCSVIAEIPDAVIVAKDSTQATVFSASDLSELRTWKGDAFMQIGAVGFIGAIGPVGVFWNWSSIHAVDLRTGEVAWAIDGTAAWIVDDVIVIVNDDGVHGFGVEGLERWKANLSASQAKALLPERAGWSFSRDGPLVHRGIVRRAGKLLIPLSVSSTQGEVLAIDERSGAVSTLYPQLPPLERLLLAKGALVGCTSDGRLIGLRDRPTHAATKTYADAPSAPKRFELLSTTPARNAESVPLGVSLRLVFSGPIDPSSVTTETVAIVPAVTGEPPSLRGARTIERWIALDPETTYVVTVNGVKGKDGRSVAWTTLSFRTKDRPEMPKLASRQALDSFLRGCRRPMEYDDTAEVFGWTSETWCGDLEARFRRIEDIVGDALLSAKWIVDDGPPVTLDEAPARCSALAAGSSVPTLDELRSLFSEKGDRDLGFVNPAFASERRFNFVWSMAPGSSPAIVAFGNGWAKLDDLAKQEQPPGVRYRRTNDLICIVRAPASRP